MLQKNSFVLGSSEYVAGRQISHLSGFQTVILEKGTLEEQYQLQSVSE